MTPSGPRMRRGLRKGTGGRYGVPRFDSSRKWPEPCKLGEFKPVFRLQNPKEHLLTHWKRWCYESTFHHPARDQERRVRLLWQSYLEGKSGARELGGPGVAYWVGEVDRLNRHAPRVPWVWGISRAFLEPMRRIGLRSASRRGRGAAPERFLPAGPPPETTFAFHWQASGDSVPASQGFPGRPLGLTGIRIHP
jgi:hypothetical protein